MSVKLTIEGFETIEQADEFINWFSNSGEQDAMHHFEEHGDGKTPVLESQPDHITMRIKMIDT